MKRILIAVVLMICSTAQASESFHRDSVEKMLEATKAEKNMASIYSQIENMFDQQFKQIDVPEEAKPILVKYQKLQIDIMKNELSWAKLKNDMVNAYMQVFSESEVKEITKFYLSPAGIKFVDKLPELTQAIMNAVQSKMPDITDKYKQLGEQMAKEMEQFDKEKKTGK